MRSTLVTILACCLAAAACDSPRGTPAIAASPDTEGSTPVASPTATPSGLIAGTPEGDLGDWVKEIRVGIAKVPALVESDPAAAQKAALDMYVTRQEYAEMYYGIDGRIKDSPELSQAVETAEERFHDLMKLLATTTPKPDRVAVESAVDALDAQQKLVAKLWKTSGLSLERAVAK
jgi:hypothetical protein